MKFLKNELIKFYTLTTLFSLRLSCLSIEPEILWFFETKDACFGQTAAGDIDGDSKFELVFGCYRNDGNIYALNAEDGSLVWKFSTARNNIEGCNDVAILLFDINNDKIPEVIAPSSCNPKTFCLDGKTGNVIWSTNTNGSDSPPTIADIDNDDRLEILHGEFGGSVICIDAQNGNLKWRLMINPNSWIQTSPTIVDLDLDGNLDFVVATWVIGNSDSNAVYAFRGYDRKLLWERNVSGVVYHGPCVTNLDDDPYPELLIGDYSGKIYAIESELGIVKWSFSANYYVGAPILSADFNNDGNCEIIYSDAFGIGSLDRNGNTLWYFQNPDYSSSFRGPTISDIYGDGQLDLIFATSSGYLRALDGNNGKQIFELNLAQHYQDTFEIDNAPVIADFDFNGELDAFIIGGKARFPDFSHNYGRAYMIKIGTGTGSNWLMFQGDAWRRSSLCRLNHNSIDAPHTHPNILQVLIKEDKNLVITLDSYCDEIEDISLFDLLGCRVRKFSPNVFEWKKGLIEIPLINVPNGIYILKIVTKTKTITHLLLL
ncbi:MAG: outer membrane protein assembly factor BamB family protein [Candidatus Kapaibacteriales bacterium]